MRKTGTVLLGFLFLFLTVIKGSATDNVVFQDNFENSANWDPDYKKGDIGFKESGADRFGGGINVKNNCFVLGTSATGATLKKEVPNDVIVETKVKVSIIKDKPEQSDPGNPSAVIHLRKTEKDNIWRSYMVHLWFWKDGDGLVLITQYEHNLAEGKEHIKPKILFEKKWPLHLDVWYDLRVMIVSNQITLWVDGEEIGTATDPDNLFSKGTVALSGYSWPSFTFFKDFKVLKAE